MRQGQSYIQKEIKCALVCSPYSEYLLTFEMASSALGARRGGAKFRRRENTDFDITTSMLLVPN